MLLRTQLLYNLPLIIKDTSLFIGKQWHQLPELIPTNSNSGLHSCIVPLVFAAVFWVKLLEMFVTLCHLNTLVGRLMIV